MAKSNDYWAIIPAAGAGKRMQSNIPKQYLLLDKYSILHHTISIFLTHPKIKGIVVAISEGDEYWQQTADSLLPLKELNNKQLLIAKGGKERSDSVLSALKTLDSKLSSNCWTLVHDAARPCLLAKDIDKLIEAVDDSSDGGLLGLPIVDTLKRCNKNNQVIDTVDRTQVWRALTPQCFKRKLLQSALISASKKGLQEKITDESSAIELLGLSPIMIEGDSANIKITVPQDLEEAREWIKIND